MSMQAVVDAEAAAKEAQEDNQQLVTEAESLSAKLGNVRSLAEADRAAAEERATQLAGEIEELNTVGLSMLSPYLASCQCHTAMLNSALCDHGIFVVRLNLMGILRLTFVCFWILLLSTSSSPSLPLALLHYKTKGVYT